MKIEDIRDLPANSTLWDKDDRQSVKGLHIRSNSKGVKSFFLYYRSKNGTQRRPKLGEFGEITLAEARKRAKVLLERVYIGEDPKGNWDQDKAEMTVAELFQKAFEEYWNKVRFKRSGRTREVELTWKNHLEKPFGKKKLSEVTISVVKSWHSSMEKTPYAANRALEVLSRMFRFAEESEIRPQGQNPCTLVKAYTEKKRTRKASPEEIKAISEVLEEEAKYNPGAVAYIYTLMLTGSRPKFLKDAYWSDLKVIEKDGLKYGVLTLAGKGTAETGSDEVVIIPPQAMRYIINLPRVKGKTIFGIKSPKDFWKRIRSKVGLDDLWARDLRRTFASIGLSNGVEVGTIGELLNHKSAQTTKIYAHLMHEKRIEAATKVANVVEQIINEKED